MGRADLGEGLAKIIDKAAKGRRFADLGLGLDEWEGREKDRARKRYGNRTDALALQLEAIADKAECVRVIWSASNATSAAALKTAIASVFADQDPKVTLSSVHRAKGLEAPRVFIAKPERLGQSRDDDQDWMREQEENLEYVAYTRVQKELVFLDGAPERWMLPAPNETPASTNALTKAYEALGVERVNTVELEPGNSTLPLPPVGADAPDVYDPEDLAARVALARRLDAYLRAEGFTPRGPSAADQSWGTEVTYERERGGVVCKVDSTIVRGEVRGVGKDAIRVSLVRDGRGIGKARRVNRVGKIEAIVERVGERIAGLVAQTADPDRPRE